MPFNNPNLRSALLAVAGFLTCLLLPFHLIFEAFGLEGFHAHNWGDILKNLVIIGYGYWLIQRFGYLNISGFFSWKPRHLLLLIVPLYILLLGPAEYFILDYNFDSIQWADVSLLLLATLSVGISEEVIFRGFVLPHLIKGNDRTKSLLGPLILAAVLFGVLHLFNLFKPDSEPILVLAQVIYASMFGVAFGIVLLRTRSLLPLGILHGLINFSSSWGKLPGAVIPPELEEYQWEEAGISILYVLPFLIYTLRQLPGIRKANLFPDT